MKGLFFITIAAYISYVICAEDLPSVNCPPYDENSTGPFYVPHPCNCNVYYLCLPPVNKPMKCELGYHFNSITQKCDFPWVAKCKVHPKCPKSEILDDVMSQEEVVSQ
ncbi:peritrophin-1-like [Osmia bicornis bicornis]|uniref:peritrophin-1-like n=1 Tax=Osmia bicornis bicornis TaxID=1437191 RepID=UPI001EAF0909|nr:peritrophin-1-like [Osmia bicornis bicornis]